MRGAPESMDERSFECPAFGMSPSSCECSNSASCSNRDSPSCVATAADRAAASSCSFATPTRAASTAAVSSRFSE